MWWRVELDEAGQVVHCDEVEAPERRQRSVRYIEADSKARAQHLAVDWYARDREYKRKHAQKRRAEAVAQGLCGSCRKRKPEKDKAQCKICTRRKAAQLKDWRERGCPPLQRVDPVKALEQKQAINKNYQEQRTTYGAILRAFDNLGADRFRAWVVGRIDGTSPRDFELTLPEAAE